MSYIMRNLAFLGVLALPLFAIACASPASDGASSSEANETVGSSVTATPFTADDHLDAYTARMRVSVGDAAPEEVTGMCSVDSWTTGANQFRCTGNLADGTQVVLDLGKAGDGSLEVGTYSSADADGRVMQFFTAVGNNDSIRYATTSTIGVDSVGAAPSPSTEMRVTGHFTAAAGAMPGGLLSLLQPMTGTFLMDVPHPVAQVQDAGAGGP